MRQPLPITNYQYPDGTPVANGKLTINLNTGGLVSGNHIQFNKTTVLLDSSGNITGSPLFWPNADIYPTGTYYIVTVYDSTGNQVSGPDSVIV